ncbi:MAG: SRPBCC family protein [Mycobacterium sp.]
MAGQHSVWQVLADFGALSAWADRAEHSSMLSHGPDGGPVGDTRRVQMGRTTLVERITEFAPTTVLAYDVEGLPKRLGKLANRWTLRTVGTGTDVTITSTVHIGSGPLSAVAERVLCRVMAKRSESMLAGLARRLENPDA